MILDIVAMRERCKTLGIDIEKGKLTCDDPFSPHCPREHRELLRTLLESRDVDKGEKIRNLILPSVD